MTLNFLAICAAIAMVSKKRGGRGWLIPDYNEAITVAGWIAISAFVIWLLFSWYQLERYYRGSTYVIQVIITLTAGAAIGMVIVRLVSQYSHQPFERMTLLSIGLLLLAFVGHLLLAIYLRRRAKQRYPEEQSHRTRTVTHGPARQSRPSNRQHRKKKHGRP
ncbi:hypothetical protein [Paenibacillus daejeonensis]|uniref:hypothetical protein n=1 Tax=Paenibacillus daejeonensis TaxID=135193 RepID=UPI0003A5F47A|nr:hypothetical protein [Paenibacillus daejeonensis]